MHQRTPFQHHHAALRQVIEETRELLARSLELLRECPQPDTFIGRKTQEPFPLEEPKE